MKFDYFKLSLSQSSVFFGKTILKPIISVKVTYANQSINYAALIDSGADFSIFDAEIGECLGINVKTGLKKTFGGVQSGELPAEAFLHKVVIEIGGWNYTTTVGFSYNIAAHGYGILGQKGFFDIFVVKFDLLKEEIELKEHRK